MKLSQSVSPRVTGLELDEKFKCGLIRMVFKALCHLLPMVLKISGRRCGGGRVAGWSAAGAVRQSVIATLGRADALAASGALASLLTSGAKLADQVLLINALDEDAEASMLVAQADRRPFAVWQIMGAARQSARFSAIS